MLQFPIHSTFIVVVRMVKNTSKFSHHVVFYIMPIKCYNLIFFENSTIYDGLAVGRCVVWRDIFHSGRRVKAA